MTVFPPLYRLFTAAGENRTPTGVNRLPEHALSVLPAYASCDQASHSAASPASVSLSSRFLLCPGLLHKSTGSNRRPWNPKDVELQWGRQNLIVESEEFHHWFYKESLLDENPIVLERIPDYWRGTF